MPVDNIYEYAKNFDADYYDGKSGCLFHVQEYNRMLGLGITTAEIRITDIFGNFIGYAKKEKI